MQQLQVFAAQAAIAKLPETPVRIYATSDFEYFRRRAGYHLYPHNVLFDPFADTLPPAPLLYAVNPRQELLAKLRRLAVELGYQEARTTAFMDSRDPDRLQLPAGDVRRRAVQPRLASSKRGCR